MHTLRLKNVRAAVWSNRTESGATYLNVTYCRSYRDQEGNWHTTESFGRDDLLLLAKVADQVHTWIWEQKAIPAPRPGRGLRRCRIKFLHSYPALGLFLDAHFDERMEGTPVLHVHIAPRSFLARLKAASVLAGRRWPNAVLESIRLDAAAGGRGLLRASNGDASVAVDVPLQKVLSPGAVQLPKGRLPRLVAEARGAVTIEEVPADSDSAPQQASVPTRKVTVRTPRGSMTLPTFDPSLFPLPEVATTRATVALPAWRLVRLIERTAFAADAHASRYAPGALVFAFADGSLDLVGTDGRRLAHAMEPAAGTGLRPPAHVLKDRRRRLIPGVSARALAGLATVLRSMEAAPPPSLTLGFTRCGMLRVDGRGLSFSARMTEGVFPEWKSSFPELGKAAIRVDDPARLEKALKEAARFTTREWRSVELRLRRHTLAIAVENDEAATSVELLARNLSEDPGTEASAVIDPASLLGLLAVQRVAFVLRFPPGPGGPIFCEAEGFRYLFTAMDGVAAPAADDAERATGPEEVGDEEPFTPEAMAG